MADGDDDPILGALHAAASRESVRGTGGRHVDSDPIFEALLDAASSASRVPHSAAPPRVLPGAEDPIVAALRVAAAQEGGLEPEEDDPQEAATSVEDRSSAAVRAVLNQYTINNQGDVVYAPDKRPKRDRPRTRLPTSVLRQVYTNAARGVQRSTAAAQRVVWRAKRDKQDQGIKAALEDVKAQPEKPTAVLNKGFDEATQWLALTQKQAEVYQRALTEKVYGHTLLSSDQKDVLVAMLQDIKAGWVKVITQRVFLKWGTGAEKESEVVVEPMGLQNTRASTLLKSLDLSNDDLSFENFLNEWCPHVRIAFLNVRSDSAGGCERAKDELEELCEPWPNAVLVRTSCIGHLLGIMGADGSAMENALNRTFQICKLLCHAE